MLSAAIYQNPALILAGQSLSAPVALGAMTLVGISMPAVWTAAGLSFQVSPDGGATWQELFDDKGTPIGISSMAGAYIVPQSLPPYNWRGVNYLKVRSGTLALPVLQVANAAVNILSRSEMI